MPDTGRLESVLRASVNVLPYRLRAVIRHLPGVSALQRWIVRDMISGKPFVHTINAGAAADLSFEVILPLDKAVWAGTYEVAFADAIVSHTKKGDVCYDIGGYRGYMSGVMALAGASLVATFEPLPENQRALRRLCELNKTLPITVVDGAVGDVDGRTVFKVMSDPSMGKLSSSGFQTSALSSIEIEIAIRRLDTVVESGDIPPPDLIKIDVEGAELDVLRGAGNVLRDFRPVILIEAHSAELERACTSLLTQLNYQVKRLETDIGDADQVVHLVCTPR